MEHKFLFALVLGISVLASSDSCRDCFVSYRDNYDFKTMTVPTNTEFSYTASCYKYNCNCQCSGAYSCGTGVYDCPCKPCELDASKQPGQFFNITHGCYKEICRCHCQGGYTCGVIEKIC